MHAIYLRSLEYGRTGGFFCEVRDGLQSWHGSMMQKSATMAEPSANSYKNPKIR